MQKRFSCPDFFSKKIKSEKKLEPEPVQEVVAEATERTPMRASDRAKPSSLHKIRSAPYLIVGAVIVSIALSVALLASPGHTANGARPAVKPAPAVQPAPAPASIGWTEHKRPEELAAAVQPAPPQNAAGKPAEATPPPVKPAAPKHEKPKPEIIYLDPEHDLFDFAPASLPPPANLSKEVKDADKILDRGRELMRVWDETRAKQRDGARGTVIEARKAFEQAIKAYRAAAANAPNDRYIKSQLEVANKLYYLAMKSSPL